MQLKKSLVLIMVLALSLIILTACDNSTKPTVADASALVGTWELDAAALMTDEEKAQLEAVPGGLDALKMTFTFSADGKLTLAGAGQEIPAGEYTVSGDKITMDMSAITGEAGGTKSEGTFSINGDKLSLTMEGETQVLTKK